MLAQVPKSYFLQMVINVNRKALIALLAIMLLAAIQPITQTRLPLRADQSLLTLAAQHPTQHTPVIVRLSDINIGIEQRIVALGGRITDDLSIIKAVAAMLPAGQIPQLARANGIAWISPDMPIAPTACTNCVSAANLTNVYIKTIRANKVWSSEIQGQGIGVAVIDSGVNPNSDLYTYMGDNRLDANVAYNNGYNSSTFDAYGHGTHISGIIGGNGRQSNGKYVGVAPLANIINVKVSDDLNNGAGTAKSVVKGLQWILNNKSRYNIRVVNISINSAENESYNKNPIDAAAEILWNNGIVVIVAAGNRGAGTVYPPANDPFVITVGATDDRGTPALNDDMVASFSAYGTTSDGFAKPDIVAPGKNIISLLGNLGIGLPAEHPANIVDLNYFRMSGTSVSAPMVSAAAALLLQREPSLTPNQVKYRLMQTANKSWPGYNASYAGAGILDVYAAITTPTTQSANTNIQASALLGNGSQPINWNSTNWNSVNWNSVNWNSDYWGN